MSKVKLGTRYIDYPIKGSWYRHNLDPAYSYERTGWGFITNGKGVVFRLHGSTKPEEIIKLCAYLDELEALCEKESGT